MKINPKILNLIPALWVSILDFILTVNGQSSEYWNGNTDIANEGNPIGNYFMKTNTNGIFLVCGFWILLIIVLGYFLPRKISRIFLLFVLIANSWGASSWLTPKFGFWSAIILFLFNAILYVLIDDFDKKAGKSIPDNS